MSMQLRLAGLRALITSACLLCSMAAAQAAFPLEVTYRLPAEPTNHTYRVTLAAAPASDPDWIVATVLAGAPRTVTAANGGIFTATWDGKDENFVTLPDDVDYVFKGIYMPARRWAVDAGTDPNLYHSITLRYVMSVGDSLSPRKGRTYRERWSGAQQDDDRVLPWLWGWNYGYPADIDVGPNGIAALALQRVENTWSFFLLDLNRPIGWEQCVGGDGFVGGWPCGFYESNQLLGANAVACNGFYMWGSKFNDRSLLFRPDCLSHAWYAQTRPYWTWRATYGESPPNLEAWSATPDRANVCYLYVPQPATDKLLVVKGSFSGNPSSKQTGQLLQENSISGPRAMVMDPASAGSRLYVLHEDTSQWMVSRYAISNGLTTGSASVVFPVPAQIPDPDDMEVGYDGRFYFCDAGTDSVYGYDPATSNLVTVGSGLSPEPGRYQRDRFYAPEHVALWRDNEDVDRLLVVEHGGPGRISEWKLLPEGAALEREWFFCQDAGWTGGYAMDPANPSHVYMRSSWDEPRHLIRYVVDYTNGTWDVDAVWPLDIGGFQFLRVVNHPTNGHTYVVFPGGGIHTLPAHFAVYRLDNDDPYILSPSAGALPNASGTWWHDADGDGVPEAGEYTNPSGGAWPGGGERWGDHVLDDLTFVISDKPTDKFYFMSPSGFDAQGNPIYDGQWQFLLRDFGTERKVAGTDTAFYAGNEYRCNADHWVDIDGNFDDGFYAMHNFYHVSGQGDEVWLRHHQFKLTRYVPDGDGWRAKFRVGQKTRIRAVGSSALPQGSKVVAGSMVTRPVYGLVGVMDRMGVYHVFTDDGLYVDMLGVDRYRIDAADANVLWRRLGGSGMYLLGDDTSYGVHYLHEPSGKVYVFMSRGGGTIYEAQNWEPGLIQSLAIGAVPQIAFDRSEQTVSESNVVVSVSVNLDRVPTDPVSVRCDTIGGTAEAGVDYLATNALLHFEVGVTNATVGLVLLSDEIQEDDETIVVQLSDPSGGVLGLTHTQTITIQDDDWPDVFFDRAASEVSESAGDVPLTVRLSKPSVYPVVVALTFSPGSATSGEDYIPETRSRVGPYTNWAHRLRFRTAGYEASETLTDFPVLLRLNETDCGAFRYADMLSPQQGDLRFSDSSGTVSLSCDIEHWNTNGTSTLWVRLPELADAESSFWMHWGMAGVAKPAAATNGATWSAPLRAVYHLNESDAGSRRDATPNGYDGTPQGYEGDEHVSGVVGGADTFDGNDDGIRVLDTDGLDIRDAITVSAWLRAARWDADDVMVRKDNAYRFYNRDMEDGTSALTLKIKVGGSGREVNYPITNLDLQTWYHVAGTYDSSGGTDNMCLYVNGSRVAAATFTGAIDATAEDVYLGKKFADGVSSQFFNGVLDEVRIAATARSPAWIRASWTNQMPGSGFLACDAVAEIRFEPGVTSTSVTLRIVDDVESEDRENVTVAIAGISWASAGMPDRHDVTILDNEDEDADGLPDWWERLYARALGHDDGDDDPDNDGHTNLEEFYAGTSPTNPLSRLAFNSIDHWNGSHAVLSWLSVSNRVYNVGKVTNLMVPWSVLISNLPATPPVNVYSDLLENTRPRYYRIGIGAP